MKQPKTTTLDALTGIRFFAAIYVVLYHYIQTIDPEARWYAHAPTYIRQAILCAPASVTLFFMLSGFVLFYRYSKQPSGGWRSFWVARFARVYPLYIVALLVALPQFLWLLPDEWVGNMHHRLVGTALALPLLQTWFPPYRFAVNVATWTMSVEVFFYLVFPVLRRWVVARSHRGLVALGIASVLAKAAIVAGSRLGEDNPIGVVARYVVVCPLAYIPVFVLGMVAGALYMDDKREQRRGPSSFVVYSTFVAIPVIFALASTDWGHEEWVQDEVVTTMCMPVFAIMCRGLAHGETAIAKALGRPIWVTLGNATYSLYLLHKPLLNTMLWILGIMAGKQGFDQELPDWAGWLFVLAMVGLSVASYKWFETPVGAWIRRRLKAPRSA